MKDFIFTLSLGITIWVTLLALYTGYSKGIEKLDSEKRLSKIINIVAILLMLVIIALVVYATGFFVEAVL